MHASCRASSNTSSDPANTKPKALVVGDRVATDVRGARNFGLKSALIKSGEFDPGDLDGSY